MKSMIRLARESRSTASSSSEHTAPEPTFDYIRDVSETVVVEYESRIPINGISVAGDFLGIQSSQGLYEYLLSCSAGFTKLRDRTCLAIGGTVTGDGLQPAGHMPEWLRALIECIQKQILELLDLSQPNHALINVYEPGEGILAHEDGPAYSPYAVILSLGSACMFDFVEKSETRRMLGQVYLPVGSVLVFRDEAYKSVLHQFAARRFDQIPSHAKFDPARLGSAKLVGSSLERGKRISITLRHVRVRQEL